MKFRRIYSIDDFDFNGMLSASLPYLVGDNLSGGKPMDIEAYYRRILPETLREEGGLGTIYGDTNGDYVLTSGLLSEGVFHIRLGLVAPINGSRSFLYSPEWGEEWERDLASYGAHTIQSVVPVGSSIARLLRVRHPQCGFPKVTQEGEWVQQFKIRNFDV